MTAPDEAKQLLADLVAALDGAFISAWQSTHPWQQQLDAAREWLADHPDQEPTK